MGQRVGSANDLTSRGVAEEVPDYFGVGGAKGDVLETRPAELNVFKH
ncbi:hypothetical protein [Pseudofrankia sp. DC12]|nr:hypothetical protein [Pseudofrankia sp. DC12]